VKTWENLATSTKVGDNCSWKDFKKFLFSYNQVRAHHVLNVPNLEHSDKNSIMGSKTIIKFGSIFVEGLGVIQPKLCVQQIRGPNFTQF
jgi:hypothetical protein